MEENRNHNNDYQINLLKKILLYMNATAVRASNTTSMLSEYRNSRSRGFSVIIIVISEYVIAKFIFPDMTAYCRNRIWFFGLAFHSLIDFVFLKDILVIARNYNAYYNKLLFYIFIAFLAVGFVGVVIMFNNHIGRK